MGIGRTIYIITMVLPTYKIDKLGRKLNHKMLLLNALNRIQQTTYDKAEERLDISGEKLTIDIKLMISGNLIS